jgi:hypothetical protein
MGESIVFLASLEKGSYTISAREETIDYVTTVLVPTIRQRNKATIGTQDTALFLFSRSSHSQRILVPTFPSASMQMPEVGRLNYRNVPPNVDQEDGILNTWKDNSDCSHDEKGIPCKGHEVPDRRVSQGIYRVLHGTLL